MRTLLLIVVLALCWLPATSRAQGEGETPEPAEQETPEPAGEAAAPVDEVKAVQATVDPLTRRMEDLVGRYYGGIGVEATEAELAEGVQAIQLMLLDGVSLHRIDAAVTEAVRLHTPGRRIPFPIAVPLRVRPAEPGEEGAPTAEPSTDEKAVPAEQVVGLDPALEERRSELRRQRDARQQRVRLYRQWKERTRERRTLIGLGIPMLASGYAIGFAVGGAMSLTGEMPYYSSWVTAVPVVGAMILGIWAEGGVPALFVLSGLQMAGVALIVAAVAKKVDWPYDDDPMALRIGKRRDGRPAVTIAPTGTGLVGRF